MKRIIILFLMFILFSINCYADSESLEQVGNDTVNEIEQEFGFKIDEFLSLGADDYLNLIIDSFTERLQFPLKFFLTITVVMIFSSVARNITLNNNAISSSLDTIINIVFFLLLLAPVLSVQGSLSDAIIDCKNFLNSFLMVFVTLLATSGQPGTAAVASGFFSASIFILSEILTEIVLPIASIYLAIRSCSLCVNTIEFSGVADMLRRFARYILIAVSTIFTAVLGMQSLISAATDGVAVRTGKFIVGSGVPIIGPVVQDAITMVLGGVSAIKTTAGVAAIIAVIIMFIPLFIDCIIYIILFELTSVMAEVSGCAKVNKLTKSGVYAMEIFFSCIVLFCLMITISLLTFMLSGGVV